MKKISFVLFSIILLSCNGNNSVRNQETIISDDTKTNITDLSIYNIIDLCRNNNFIV